MGQSVPEGSVSKLVEDVAAAVRVPLEREVMVAFWPLRETTPAKSSIKSSWPAARFELLRGRRNEVRTLVVPELLKLTVRVVPVRVIALAILKSRPRPVLAEKTWERLLMRTELMVPGLKEQIALTAQAGLVRATPVSLRKVSC